MFLAIPKFYNRPWLFFCVCNVCVTQKLQPAKCLTM